MIHDIEQYGYAAIVYKDADSVSRIPRSDYQRVLAEWMAGKAFIKILSIDGIEAHLKAASILCVEDISPEGHANWKERQRIERIADAVEGL